MNKTKKLGLLCGALVVVSAAAFGVSRMQENKEKIQSGDSVIAEISSDSASALSWETESTSLSFTKNEDGSWIYGEDEAFPVSTTEIENLLSSFEDLESSYTIEEAEDLSQYGLDDPVCTITVTADDTDYTIELGGYSTMDSQRYASIGDGNVYMLKSDLYETFDIELSALIQNDSLPSFDSISSVTFTGLADYTFTKEEDDTLSYNDSDTYYTDGKPLDTDSVNTYISTIRYLGLSEYASYNVSEEELEAYGLDDPVLTAEIAYTDENEDGDAEDGTFTLELGVNQEELADAVKAGTWNEDGTPAAAEEDSDEDSESSSEETVPTFYARINGSQIVYIISETTYEALTAASYDDLRHSEVLTASFDDITSIDIELEGETYTLTSQGEDDDKTWSYEEEEIDLTDLQTAFEAVSAASFTEGNPSDKTEISFTLHLDNENFPEVTIAFYRYDGNYCISEVDGEPVSMVDRSSVVSLIEAVNAIIL